MELFEKFELSAEGLSYSGHRLSEGLKHESTVGTKAEPLYIHTDSDTDWAALSPSIAGVVVTLIVAWLTVKVQKNQTKANLSNFRSQWMSELRTCGSEYLMAMLDMAVKNEMDKSFESSGQRFEAYRQIMALGMRFELLLTGRDDDATRLLDLESNTAQLLLNLKQGEDSQTVIDNINELKMLLRAKLENAWTDIKKDVGKTQ